MHEELREHFFIDFLKNSEANASEFFKCREELIVVGESWANDCYHNISPFLKDCDTHFNVFMKFGSKSFTIAIKTWSAYFRVGWLSCYVARLIVSHLFYQICVQFSVKVKFMNLPVLLLWSNYNNILFSNI